MKYIYDLHRTMLSQNLILVYEGEFTQEITKSVLSMAERNMDSFKEENSIKRKVFNVMVECLQNIVKHADDIEIVDGSYPNNAIFMVGKEEDKYLIASGNIIAADRVTPLSERLARINQLDRKGLRDLYRRIISEGSLSDKGGAGLGFVDMCRKSGNPLEYDFEPINEELSFFSLLTSVSRSKGDD